MTYTVSSWTLNSTIPYLLLSTWRDLLSLKSFTVAEYCWLRQLSKNYPKVNRFFFVPNPILPLSLKEKTTEIRPNVLSYSGLRIRANWTEFVSYFAELSNNSKGRVMRRRGLSLRNFACRLRGRLIILFVHSMGVYPGGKLGDLDR